MKTKKVNPPEIFFTPPSLVTDYYEGNFESLSSLLKEKDVALVTFYAPWDAASLQVREEIEIVAKFYHNEVCLMVKFVLHLLFFSNIAKFYS